MRRALPVLGTKAIETRVGIAAGTDGPGDHPLPLHVSFDIFAKLLNHAYRLMPHREALGYGVLAFEDVNVGSADGRGCETDQRIVGSDIGHRLVVQDNPPWLNVDGCFHHFGHN